MLTPCPLFQGLNKKEKTQVRNSLQVLPYSSRVRKSREQSWEQLFFSWILLFWAHSSPPIGPTIPFYRLGSNVKKKKTVLSYSY